MQALTTTTASNQQLIGLERHLALCETCFWSATIFGRDSISACPSCANKNVSLTPLAKDEEYSVKISPSAGIEMSFYRLKKV